MGEPPTTSIVPVDDDISLEGAYHDYNGRVKEKGSTSIDGADMSRMGKKQELKRNFKFIGIVGFVTILQVSRVQSS